MTGPQCFEIARRTSGRMCDQSLQARRESFDLGHPVGQQRSGGDQQARPRTFFRGLLAAGFALEQKKQRQHLYGFAKSHIVGQTGAKAKFCQQIKPSHAHLLIRPQPALQCITRVGPGQALRTPQRFQRFCQPGTRYHLSPARAITRRYVGSRNIGSRHQTHGFAKAEAVLARRSLGFAEALHHLLQVFPVQLNPSASHQRESI